MRLIPRWADFSVLLQALASGTGGKRIDLSGMQLGPPHARAVAQAISACAAAGAAAAAAWKPLPPSLATRTLDLRNNPSLGEEGVAIILEALSTAGEAPPELTTVLAEGCGASATTLLALKGASENREAIEAALAAITGDGSSTTGPSDSSLVGLLLSDAHSARLADALARNAALDERDRDGYDQDGVKQGADDVDRQGRPGGRGGCICMRPGPRSRRAPGGGPRRVLARPGWGW